MTNMCRNIKRLFNFEPGATNEEIHAASLQFVKKVSGFAKPSHENEETFNHAIIEIEHIVSHLIHDLVTKAEPHNRETEARRAHARTLQRFSPHK